MTNRPIQAWLCCPDTVTAASVAGRLQAAGALDAVRIPAPTEEIPADAALVVLAPNGMRLPTCGSVAAVRAAAPHTTVLVALRGVTVAEIVDLLSGGVDAVVDLDADDQAVAHGIRAALRDGSYVPSEHQGAAIIALARRRRADAQRRARVAKLTPTEREILALLIAGADRPTIAARLNESASRVRARIDRLKSKLGVSSQREAVAMVSGLPQPAVLMSSSP